MLISRKNKQRNPLTGVYPHPPTPTERIPTILQHQSIKIRINYFHHFSLIIFSLFILLRLSTIRCLFVQVLKSNWALGRLRKMDMTIIICHNDLPDRKRGWLRSWSESSGWMTSCPEDMAREFWDFVKDGDLTFDCRSGRLRFWIWSDQISLGLDRHRWVEILDTTKSTVFWGFQDCILAYAFMNCVSLLVLPKA